MVYFFTSTVVDPPAFIYMGKDKEENELLIQYGLPEDIWFHVDKLSSAHVYIRLAEGQTIDDVTDDLVHDCCQLVKANSIEGSKRPSVSVVYTPWANLKKTGDMAPGQVGFHDGKQVKKFRVEKKINEIVNRLNKTKVEKFPDLAAEQLARQEREIIKQKRLEKEKREREAAEAKRRAEEAELRSYDRLKKEENMTTNKYDDSVDFRAVEDDFM
eukprot:m.338731 g.338731  ORF g.338731 m.338731 type:complete len:214 (+) comp18527_c0_seq1:122-763(+)